MESNNVTDIIKLQKLSDFARLPTRATSGSAGLDLFSPKAITILPGERLRIKTDLQLVALPPGTYLRLASRSGLAIHHSLDVCGGVVDADYRGPIDVILANNGHQTCHINPGDRFAQMICERYVDAAVTFVNPHTEENNLTTREQDHHFALINDETNVIARDTKGFGSTGH